MEYPFSIEELTERIRRNRDRLCEPYYQISEVFMPPAYDWPGDKEGRALLAFVCHARMGTEPIPCMKQMLAALPEKTNPHGYFGPSEGSAIDEQQLSGHSWYLRGLCEYYELTGSTFALETVKKTVSHLYLPLLGAFSTYPIGERRAEGGVSGSSADALSGRWRLSSDVGCAFMSIDGLSHAYELTKDPRILSLLREMVTVFDAIDKRAIKAQTHCSLTAARGMLRLYRLTADRFFLDCARRIADLYLEDGMTLTYQNLNWWGRPDSWTEPCAIVDSLIVCTELFKLTGVERYRISAVRIAHNGFATLQRANGGAGCDTIVLPGQGELRIFMDEAPFCCTMRLAEGLRYLTENRTHLTASLTGTLVRDREGRVMNGDLLYVPLTGALDPCADRALLLELDGDPFIPLPKFFRIPLETAKALRIAVL